MCTLRRELARQKLTDTAIRVCFPTATVNKVKRYIRFAMRLMPAGATNKFQIVKRKGQPVLQTGMRKENYFNYQGVVENED
jgi:hypothetical protein